MTPPLHRQRHLSRARRASSDPPHASLCCRRSTKDKTLSCKRMPGRHLHAPTPVRAIEPGRRRRPRASHGSRQGGSKHVPCPQATVATRDTTRHKHVHGRRRHPNPDILRRPRLPPPGMATSNGGGPYSHRSTPSSQGWGHGLPFSIAQDRRGNEADPPSPTRAGAGAESREPCRRKLQRFGHVTSTTVPHGQGPNAATDRTRVQPRPRGAWDGRSKTLSERNHLTSTPVSAVVGAEDTLGSSSLGPPQVRRPYSSPNP